MILENQLVQRMLNIFYESYKILRADSYFFPARIALSHSFQIKSVDAYVGAWNISDDRKAFVAELF